MKVPGENNEEEKDPNGVSTSGSTVKVNAFQFMMNNRNRVIGRNSPGKDVDSDTSPESLIKTDMNTRKNFLENWAELKGASKRKREYDEQGNSIHFKLEKRAKRFKKLLKFSTNDSDEDELIVVKKKCVTIKSDCDDSEDGDQKENKGDGSSNSRDCHQVLDDGPMSFSGKKNNIACNRMVLRTRKSKPTFEEDLLPTESDDETPSKNKKTERKVLKVAPVFLNSVPKPKPDPEVVEARRQFLLSGVPTSLKKEMEKQQSFDEADFEVFPLVSHIQQKAHENTFWKLPKVILHNLTSNEPTRLEVNSFDLDKPQVDRVTESINYDCIISNRLRNQKKIIKDIKSKNPNYPVYKMFKSLYKRSGYKLEEGENKRLEVAVNTPKRRGRKKKNSVDNNVKTVDQTPLAKLEEFPSDIMWTEKYKALTSSDIIGNHGSVASLKKWLTNWLNMSNEEKSKNSYDNDSESEFDCTEGDSTKLFRNTIILQGPVGCGKTMAVYAVCHELSFNVLEVNASSKRTGKRLLQELHEATQSHQVRKDKTVLTFFKEETEKLSKSKMCVLLVEDVDIVFEQDEGFNAALTQIITTSKRPIILTTTDECAPNVQKLMTYRQTISFLPLSSILAIWLQVVCLIEGCYINIKSLAELLEYNKGDIRRTLLQLQFFVTSGGSYKKESEDKSEVAEAEVTDCELAIEDDSNMSEARILETNESKDDVRLHHVCISNFATLQNYKLFSLPYYVNLNVIWWNLPRICHLPDFSSLRLHPNRNHCIESLRTANKSKERQKLRDLANVYDTLAFGDICDRSDRCEALVPRWYTKLKDNLTLEENMNSYDDTNVTEDLNQTLLSTTIKLYKEKYGRIYTAINMVVPSSSERRWCSRQFSSSDKLKEAVLMSDCLERSVIELDYMSTLRAIARFELRRSANNTKRGGRFYNYLRNLGVSAGDSTYKSACDVFKIRD